MRWISQRSFLPFVVYRILLGIVLLLLLAMGVIKPLSGVRPMQGAALSTASGRDRPGGRRLCARLTACARPGPSPLRRKNRSKACAMASPDASGESQVSRLASSCAM